MRALAAISATVVLLAACDDAGGGQGAPDADGEVDAAADRDEDGDPGEGPGGAPDEEGTAGPDEEGTAGPDEEGTAGPDPVLPDVLTIDVAEVDTSSEATGIDATVASAATDLPGTWQVAVVADAALGPYVVGLPATATVWRVGDDLAPLRDAAADSAWLRYWDPILEAASGAAEGSSLRAVVVLGDGDDGGHLTISATPIQDLPADDPATIADRFAETFAEQGLTVEDATTDAAGGADVAALTLTTPDDEFDDGVPRRLRQWFYPEVGTPVLWSLTCEGFAPDADRVDATCEPLLASFRPPLR